MRKIFISLILILPFILLTACTTATPKVTPQNTTPQTETQPAGGYPAPASAQSAGYPSPNNASATAVDTNNSAAKEGDHYVFPEGTAFQELKIAEEVAKNWKPNAVLIQIPRLRQMETNLSLPKGPSGWFYTFMDKSVPDSAVELYVEVSGGKAAGKSEVQQLFEGGKAPYTLLPIDFSKKLLDSNKAYQIFLDNKGKDYVKGKGKVEIDFQLVHLQGVENPVWSIFDTADVNAPPLINIDAVTGKLVDDPFAPYRK